MSEKNRRKEYYKNNRYIILNRAKEYYIKTKNQIRGNPKIKDYQKEYIENITDEKKQKNDRISKRIWKKYD